MDQTSTCLLGRMTQSIRIVSVAIAAGALVACAHEPKQPFVTDTLIETEAVVEGIDVPKRMVELRGENGARVAVVVGPNVRNLDQVEVGDKVRVTYYQGIAAELRKRGEGGDKAPVVEERLARAEPGERPAGAAGVTIRTTVKIEAVDTSFNTVTFRRPDGIVRTVAVQDPQAQEFIKRLRPGQEVDLTYTEAMAVDVKPSE